MEEKIIYYKDELNDEFSEAKIVPRKIDGNYKYIHKNPLWKLCAFAVQNILSMPIKILYVKIKFKIKYIGKEKLKKYYDLPYDEPCMHEFVLSGERQKHENGVSTLNIAKALMDGNTHPPTVYFPLIVHEAIMIEPTESEHKEKLDEFVDTMNKIAKTAKENPEEILSAPHTTPVKKIDEVQAARHPDLKYTD